MSENNSILDKVITSKKINEFTQFNPVEVVQSLLKMLSTKEADVIGRRFGLNGKEKETLEKIGKSYHVTRERIRQIEALGIKKMKETSDFVSLIKPIEHVIVNTLFEHGGIMTEKMIIDKLTSLEQDKIATQQNLIFIISELLKGKFINIPDSKKYRRGWRLTTASTEFIDQIVEELIKIIIEADKPQKLTDIIKALTKTDFYQENQPKISDEAIAACLEINQSIAKNPFEEYGLSEWGSIIPKRTDDKIHLVLEKGGKPLHFTEIAKRITEIFHKRAYPPTVHNELILNKEYVLVGRGIYALKKWGYQPGVVADVLINILKKANRPMSRQELVGEVLKQRIVKKNTIHLALTNKAIFKKSDDGKYILVVGKVNSE